MQYFDFTVAPGKVAPISCQGRRFYYYSGSAGGADMAIKVRFGTSGQSIILRPGQGVRAPAGTAISDTAYIENYAGIAPIIGMVYIGDDDIEDNRVSGSVEVIDGGLARTLGGVSFMGAANGTSAAGNLKHLQLWNPAGSGKNLVLEAYFVSSTTSNGLRMSTSNAALSGLVGAGTSKKMGAASGVGQTYMGDYVAAQGVNILATFNIQASAPFPYKFSEPLVIVPGTGLILMATTLQTDIAASFEWYEVGI